MIEDGIKMKNKCLVIAIIVLALLNVTQLLYNKYAHRLTVDAIPDEKTAISVGRAILLSTYGDMILGQEPLNVFYNSRKNCWIVSGNWPDDPNLVGGVGSITIRKRDGKVLQIYHGL